MLGFWGGRDRPDVLGEGVSLQWLRTGFPQGFAMRRQRLLLVVMALLVAGSACALPINRAPDLRGGVELTIQARPAAPAQQIAEGDLAAVQQVMEKRIKGLGVAAVVKVEGQDRVVVQLPKTIDLEQAERVLGSTGQLNFREQLEGTDQKLPIFSQNLRELQAKQVTLRAGGDVTAIAQNQALIKVSADEIVKLFKDVGLTGKSLTDAFPENQNGNSWSVAIRFDKAGGDKFAVLTQRLAGANRSIGIFLDDVLISAPVVGEEHKATGIQGGGATITGNFDAKSANELAVQLKGGALPVQVQIVEKRQL
jgi:preprotein translocase subunit SecD